jgi:hypothetical protein
MTLKLTAETNAHGMTGGPDRVFLDYDPTCLSPNRPPEEMVPAELLAMVNGNFIKVQNEAVEFSNARQLVLVQTSALRTHRVLNVICLLTLALALCGAPPESFPQHAAAQHTQTYISSNGNRMLLMRNE